MEITIEQLKTFSPDLTSAFNRLLSDLNPNSRTLSDDDAKKIIEDQSNRLLVARDSIDNKIVGMLTLVLVNTPSYRKGFLEAIVVDKNYQGKGIGKKLIESAINLAREEGANHLEFTSSPKRVEANKFYQHLGFKMRDTNFYRIDL